jgi:Zn-dependent protease
MTDATDLIFGLIILIVSIIIHEVSHGLMAYALGDKTAQYAGRLTLNPIPHIDPFGSILLPLFLIISHSPFLVGWAKPVPYNPYNLRDQRWGPALVGAAGPGSNIIVALLFGGMLRLADTGAFSFLAPATLVTFLHIAAIITYTNILLAIFNLVPIPPLDGSKVLFALAPYRWSNALSQLESMGWMLLIVFIIFFSWILSPINEFIFHLITGL